MACALGDASAPGWDDWIHVDCVLGQPLPALLARFEATGSV